MKVVLPISLDRWRNPISTLLRACVQYNPDIEFHSFSNPQTDEDRELGEQFWQLPNLNLRKSSALLTDRFDIVHSASYSDGNYLSAWVAKLRGCGHTRFLNTMNLEPDPQYQLSWKHYMRLLRATDYFVSVSEAVASDFRKRIPQRLLGVIPNGFDPLTYDPEVAKKQDLPEEIKHLEAGYPLWVASLENRKHPEVLIELAKRHPEISFVALGAASSTEGDQFAKMFRDQVNVFWLGAVERSVARTILAKAGVLIFPSELEGLSLAMIEALAMGIPIICQPKSSMPELVKMGVNGDLIDISNICGWSEALVKYMKFTKEERSQLFQRVRDHAVAHYSWETVGSAYGPIYKEVMGKSARIFYPVNQ